MKSSIPIANLRMKFGFGRHCDSINSGVIMSANAPMHCRNVHPFGNLLGRSKVDLRFDCDNLISLLKLLTNINTTPNLIEVKDIEGVDDGNCLETASFSIFDT